MAGHERWYFNKEELMNTPSRRCNMDADKELSYRQQATNLIQDMGQRLQVAQLCINTAIVYMHRFYMFHSFTKFNRNSIAACALFLAAKVEEQPRKLEHVIKVAHMCLHRGAPPLDTKSEAYNEQSQELVVNENIMLQTLGFDIDIEHPHTWVVKFCDLVRASKDLAQTSYFMATNSLHLTTMCLQYKPTVVACVCIHLAYKWSSWEIPRSKEGKDWFYYIDKTVTLNVIEELTSEFLAILDKCPSRLKQKQSSYFNDSGSISGHSLGNSSAYGILKEKKKLTPNKVDQQKAKQTTQATTSKNANSEPVSVSSGNHCPSQSSPLTKKLKPEKPLSITKSMPQPASASALPEKREAISYSAYKEKKEKERNTNAPTAPSTAKEAPAISFVRDVKDKKPEKVSHVNAQPRELVPKSSQSPNRPASSLQRRHIERHKAVEERNKIQVKQEPPSPGDKTQNVAQPVVSETISGNNIASHSLYESFGSVMGKVNWDHTDGEDSSDIRKEIVSDLKMEFSDNDSNHSNSGFNLSSLPHILHDTSSQSNSDRMKSSLNQNRSSFMSIFAEEDGCRDTASNLIVSDINKEATNDYSLNINSILEDKPLHLPPILSPLEPDITIKREKMSPLGSASQSSIENQHQSPINNTQNLLNTVSGDVHASSPMLSSKVKTESGLKLPPSKAHKSKSPLGDSVETSALKQAPGVDFPTPPKKSKDKHHQHVHQHRHHHKHKEHHKEKHKHKHKNKDKDKDKEKHRKEKSSETESQDDSKLKITLPLPKDRHQEKQILTNSPIKLKISKKKLSTDEASNEEAKLKLVISKERISGSSTSSETPSKKSKSSPREGYPSRDKVVRLDMDKCGTVPAGGESNCNDFGNCDASKKHKDLSFQRKNKTSSNVSQAHIPYYQQQVNNQYQQMDSLASQSHPGNNPMAVAGMASSSQNQRRHK